MPKVFLRDRYGKEALPNVQLEKWKGKGGERPLKAPEQLEERDPTEIALPYGADGAVVPVQKFRDTQKLCTVMTIDCTGADVR